MARGDQPLLAHDSPPSENSEDNIAEEDALLTGQQKPQQRQYGWGFWREVGLFVWAMVATAIVIVIAVMYQHQYRYPEKISEGWTDGKPNGKRNMIFMVSDGMGPTSLSMTRSFIQVEAGLPYGKTLVLDKHHIGQSRTRSTSSLVTDSAAGATAFSCGHKSYNGAISVLPDHSPCGTVLEAAKQEGYMTGLVVTTRITDATPACFAAHVNLRGEEDRIAEQMVGDHPLGRVVDLILGGGRCHFLPNGTQGSCRDDDKDIVELAKKNGFNYLDNRHDFDGLKLGSSVKLPLLGLVAERDIPYEVDRRGMNDVYPSLDEMARTALQALSEATKDNEQGFFLMIEGSRIDHAGHANDPVAQVHEILAYDKAFASVLDFLNKSEVPGVLVGTSDHETGGLAVAHQLHDSYPVYAWFPELMVNSTHSAENLAIQFRDFQESNKEATKEVLKAFVRETLIEQGLGVYDSTDEEINRLLTDSEPWPASYIFADIISRRTQVGWSTHGHSAADVNIYASNPAHAQALIGNHENTEVGGFIRDFLDVDLDAITGKLISAGAASISSSSSSSSSSSAESWMGKLPDPELKLGEVDHYHGDFKRSLAMGCCGGVKHVH